MPIAATPAARAAFFATRLAFGRKVFFALVVLFDFDLLRPRFSEDFDLVRPRFDEDLDLVRPRFDEDLDSVRLILFFIIPPSISPITVPQRAPELHSRSGSYHRFLLLRGPGRFLRRD